jgi:hypothetical protein
MLKDAHLINPNDSRDSKFTEKYSKRFEQELYLPDEYIERVQRAELSLLAIEKCWYKVEELNKNWYFKICNEYFVIPHLYRAWSSYYFRDNGTGCVHLCNSEKRPEYLPHQTAVILHEILHLGI